MCLCVWQLMRLIDMLVALSISEDAIYPLIQSCIWAKIGGERKLLKRVLDSFIRVSLALFPGSPSTIMFNIILHFEHKGSIYIYDHIRWFVVC